MNMTKDVGRINEYYDGMIEGVRLYVHWKNGIQYVGTCGKLLAKAIMEIEDERKEQLEKRK